MGRSPCTLLRRELRRNSSDGGYVSSSAHSACLKRCMDTQPLSKLHADGALWQTVCTLLGWYWSPQQIASTLRRVHPDDPVWHISHETIYDTIYAYLRGELRRQLIAPCCARARARVGRVRQARIEEDGSTAT